MRDLEFFTGHVTFKLRYNQIYQMKTTPDWTKMKQIMPHEKIEKALIENEKNVYFGSEIDTLTKFDSIPCLVSTNSDSYFGHPVAFALQKNSPYKYLVNSQLTRMKESGQMKRIMKTHIPHSTL